MAFSFRYLIIFWVLLLVLLIQAAADIAGLKRKEKQ